MRAGDGDDSVFAEGLGGDILDAGSGNDQLVTDDPCQGHDYQGGAGFDIAGFGRYDLALAGQPGNGVKATLGGTASDPARGACSPSQVRSDNEILEGSAGPDILTGDNRNNPLILGREGNDVINGGGGFDSLQGDEGSDLMNCGPGGGTALRDAADPRPRGCGKARKKK